MEDKCIVTIQKQIVMKIIIWWQVLQNFDANLKRLPWNDPSNSSASQTRGLVVDFKVWQSIPAITISNWNK